MAKLPDSVTGLLILIAAQVVLTQGLRMVARQAPLLLASPQTTAATAVSLIPMRQTPVLRQEPRLPTARTRVVARLR